MVAGDKYQAIYNFAGARYTPLSRILKAQLATTSKTVKRLTLSRSRRLTQANADFAAAIVRASGRTPPHIVGRPGGTRPRIVSHAHWDDLRDDLVVRVSKLIESGVPPSEIVVLGRVKALLTSVQASLHSAGINVQHLGRSSGIKHVLRVLRLLQWCERQAHLAATAKMVALRPSEVNQYYRDFVEGFKKRYGLPAKAKKLKMAVHDLKKLAKLVHSTEGRYIACSRVYMRLAGIRMRGGSTVVGTAPARKNGQPPLDDAEIRNGIACWTSMSRLPEWDTAGRMRRQILAIKRSDRLETRTIHSAKGREWDHVFIVGATEGLLRHYRATTKSAQKEELNLMYVAVTRTRKQLTLMHSPYTYSVRRPAVKQRYRRVGYKKVRVKATLAPSPKFTQLSSLLNHPRVRAAARTTTR
jgi:superfamily I DNA/RNA helicase